MSASGAWNWNENADFRDKEHLWNHRFLSAI